MKISKTKVLFVAVAVAGLSLTVIAEGERPDISDLLNGFSQDSLWCARMDYQRGQRL